MSKNNKYTVTMSIELSITVDAESKEHAKAIAVNDLYNSPLPFNMDKIDSPDKIRVRKGDISPDEQNRIRI